MVHIKIKLVMLSAYVALVTAMRWTWYRVKIRAWYWVYNVVRVFLIIFILHIYLTLFSGMFSL
jgi:hypothetical protein